MPGVEEFRVQAEVVVELAVRTVGVVAQVTVNGPDGVTLALKDTLPAKLRVLLRRIVVAPVAPVLKFAGPSAEMVKSPTWMMVGASWDAVPGEAVPLTVTL